MFLMCEEIQIYKNVDLYAIVLKNVIFSGDFLSYYQLLMLIFGNYTSYYKKKIKYIII